MVFVRVVHRSFRRSAFPALAGLLALAWCPRAAQASAWDVFGFGPEGVAAVSARAASATDGTATFYNPGGLGLGRGYRLQLSGLGAASTLQAQGNTKPVRNPVGMSTAIDADVPLEGPLAHRLRVGLGVYTLPDSLLRLELRKSDDPFFPYYDNRTQRFAIIPAIALRPAEGIGIGVGANVLAGVAGPIDVREGQSRALETLVEQDAGTVLAWVAGIRFDPRPDLHLAVTWRQQFGIPLEVTTTANVAGVPLVVDVTTADALYDPATLVFGIAVDLSERFHVETDGTWQRWSSWDGPLLGIDTTVSALSLSSEAPQGLYKDTFGARLAATGTIARSDASELELLGGFGYETSMLDESTPQGRTNFVDGSKLLFGAGASARFPGLLGKALRVSVGAQAQRITPTTQRKIACTAVPCPAGTVVGPDTANPDQGIDNPGYPTLSGRGAMFVASVGVGVEL